MDLYVVIALLGVALLVAELLLPTGGVLALLGALGLIAGGVVALTANSDAGASDWAGPALITLGVLSIVSFYLITGKVLAAQRLRPFRAGHEQLIGAAAEARTSLDPVGQVWIEGALWRARTSGVGSPPRPGDRVTVEAVEGLTLRVRPQTPPLSSSISSEEGAD